MPRPSVAALGRRGRDGPAASASSGNVEPRLVDFSAVPIGPFAGSFDLSGDGALTLVRMPVHIVGRHLCLLFRPLGLPALLRGDLSESAAARFETAPAIVAFCREQQITALLTHDRDAERLVAGGHAAPRDS